MLLILRPKPPGGFSKDVALARRAVKLAIAAGQTLDSIPPRWREERYKRAFAAAQHDKCGYCETFALNHPSPMDHFAPKREVHVLVNEGVELDGLYHVRDRETLTISATGYHWRTFAWDNWLLVCERCNTGWKGSLFPVREHGGFARALESTYLHGGIEGAKAAIAIAAPRPPDPRRKLTPLLLNPFGPEDPVDHLEFSQLGGVAPRRGSAHGTATIRTCGLHRESLRRVRHGFATDAYRHVERLLCALEDGDSVKALSASQDLLSLGAASRPHAGMVRCIVLSQLALRWPALEKLAQKLEPAAPPPAKPRARPRR
jgi:hypothetical protein